MNNQKTDEKTGDLFDRSASYEKYVPWQPRLTREIPFLESKLRSVNAKEVLDCACGPGRHAVALAQKGFKVVGFDASPEMLMRAKSHAGDEHVEVELVEGRFEALPQSFAGRFDALICLGNSLSAGGDRATIVEAVRQFAFALRPGGVVITQTVDFSVVAREPVTASPAKHVSDDHGESLFVKSFVRVGEQVFIHWVSLEKRDGEWHSDVTLREITVVEPRFLEEAFSRSGFASVESYGSYSGTAFEPGGSRDLILVARREGR